MKLNWRHKAGLFLTLVAVGCGLVLECSAKQAAGIALFGIAFAWLIGSVSSRTPMATFAILKRPMAKRWFLGGLVVLIFLAYFGARLWAGSNVDAPNFIYQLQYPGKEVEVVPKPSRCEWPGYAPGCEWVKRVITHDEEPEMVGVNKVLVGWTRVPRP